MFISHNQITREELFQLETHAAIFNDLDRHLEIACHRLVDANRRARPEEAIVDAVIGLESILLFGNEQELAFRFALNYSVLDFVSDRSDAFAFAKALYKLRSRIVHGMHVEQNSKYSARNLSIVEMAAKARSALRETICLFARSTTQGAFSEKGYWETRQLKLPHKDLQISAQS